MNSASTASATLACHVAKVSAVAKSTYRIELKAPAGAHLPYRAGQYLQLELTNHGSEPLPPLFYSIANNINPKRPGQLELFIQNNSPLAIQILQQLARLSETQKTVSVRLPLGNAFLQTDLHSSHLLVAAGSGIAKIKCITEEILQQRPQTELHIYWSNKQREEFYLLDDFLALADQYENLRFTPILETPHNSWQGRTGYIYQVIEKDFDNLGGRQAYLCGSPQMVYGTIDKLKAIGLSKENCYSDVFEYAPRN